MSRNKNAFAPNPPMGWNSYDYYDTTVNEEQVKANADYMAKNLKQFGWEYIVVDIQWYAYAAGTQRKTYQYIPFSQLEMDEYGRLLPCLERFPSSANGAGFKPLADYVHSLGLKFGIHIMRGIPREAAAKHLPILGSDMTANDVADPSSICIWNPDMYGCRKGLQGSQAYYDSIVALYAEWGVDYIKCDDICNVHGGTNNFSGAPEIEMLHNAIVKSGRDIVLSLSPGPAMIERAWFYEKNANMWRITGDFWDDWKAMEEMFWRCELWQDHVKQGCYPDCDMLPMGMVGKGFEEERKTNFTMDEQTTMMTLWCIFRAPLMLGAEMTLLDEETLKLLTNAEVLNLLKEGHHGLQVMRDAEKAVWVGYTDTTDELFVALFNLKDDKAEVCVEMEEVLNMLPLAARERAAARVGCENSFTEVWTNETVNCADGKAYAQVNRHGAALLKLN